MRRRHFLASLSAAGAVSGIELIRPPASSEMILAKALRPGDTVGLITPGTYVTDPDKLALAKRTLDHFGLKTRLGKNVGRRAGYFGSSSDERLDDLHAMFRDPGVQAVFAIRGGYGSAQLLDRIDYDLIRRNAKVFLGYSDITALHLAINKYSSLVTFHGPIVLSPFTEYTQRYFRSALFEAKPLRQISNPPEENRLRPVYSLRTISSGVARGPLIGGNLTLISTTMGTPYEIDTSGKILFLEDIDEETYRIDRMLTQLRLARKLDEAAGIVFGRCQDCGPRDYKPSLESNYSLGEVLDNILGKLRVPVLYGLTVGHTPDQLTLPLGVMAALDADKGILDVIGAGVK